MGYRHINNLYKDKTVLMFKRLYALEKIHGTSAHLSFQYLEGFDRYEIKYFSGGEKHDNFLQLFNDQELCEKASELGFMKSFVIYGEAYGGKQQGMSETYGKELKFAAFELKIGENFTDVPYAEQISKKLGMEFVYYEEIEADPELIDKLSNAPSVQATRNGVENPKLPREGVVLRPLREFLHPDGIGRIMAKHKNDIYKEREHSPKIQSDEELKVLEDAREIATEWVTPMRLIHVIDKLKSEQIEIDEKHINVIIKAMIEDIEREAKNEIVCNKQTRKAISQKTAKLIIKYLKENIY